MIIRMDRSFPCGHMHDEVSELTGSSICGELTIHAVLIPAEDGMYELWPACPDHRPEGRTWDGSEPLFAVGNGAEAGCGMS